jgi:hypothetical protein
VPVVGAVTCYLVLRRRAPEQRLVENAR